MTVQTVPDEKLARAILVLQRGSPTDGLARAALDAAEASIALAAAEQLDRKTGPVERLNHAIDFLSILRSMLFRDDRREVRYQVAGRNVVTVAERLRRPIGHRVIAHAIVCAWTVGRFDEAAAFGNLPTQVYRTAEEREEAAVFWTFALASIARGNQAAFDRAASNLREFDGWVDDSGELRGLFLPGLLAIEAALLGRTKIFDRQIPKLLRYHRWQHRDDPERAFDLTTSGILRWAKEQGTVSTIRDPLIVFDGKAEGGIRAASVNERPGVKRET